MSLDLDTGILDQSGQTTTSMADLYGYAVFSEEFQEELELKYQQQKEEQSQSFTYVFHNVPEDTTEQVFKQVFAAQSEVVVKEDFSPEEAGQIHVLTSIGGTLLGGVLAVMVWLLIERIRKRRKRHEDHRNHTYSA